MTLVSVVVAMKEVVFERNVLEYGLKMCLNMSKMSICLLGMLTVNPLYANGFPHTYRYNKHGTAHCVF